MYSSSSSAAAAGAAPNSSHDRLRERTSRNSTPRATPPRGTAAAAAAGGKKDRKAASSESSAAQKKQQQQDSTGSSNGNSAGKSFLDRWIEPPLRHQPSYVDTGGNSYGAAEHFQPLGEMPNARVKARFKGLEQGKKGAAKGATAASSATAGASAGGITAGLGLDEDEAASPAPLGSTSGNGGYADLGFDGAMDGLDFGGGAGAPAIAGADADDDDDYRPSHHGKASDNKQQQQPPRAQRARNVKVASNSAAKPAASGFSSSSSSSAAAPILFPPLPNIDYEGMIGATNSFIRLSEAERIGLDLQISSNALHDAVTAKEQLAEKGTSATTTYSSLLGFAPEPERRIEYLENRIAQFPDYRLQYQEILEGWRRFASSPHQSAAKIGTPGQGSTKASTAQEASAKKASTNGPSTSEVAERRAANKEIKVQPSQDQKPANGDQTTSSSSNNKAKKTDRREIVNHNSQYGANKLKEVVEAAEVRAINNGKPDLAAAVHEIYLESLYSARLTELLEAILTRTATDEENKQFQKFVRDAKKRVRRAAGKKSDDGKEQPQNGKDKTTPAAQVANDAPTGKRADAPLEKKAAVPAQKTRANSPMAGVLSPDNHAQAKPKNAPATASTDKAESSKPRLSLKVKSPEGKKKTSGEPKKRSNSVGSDSSLTSMTSNGEDDVDVDDDAPAVTTNPNNAAKKSTTAGLGGLAVPPRGSKRSSAEAELQDEPGRDRAIAAKKQKLTEGLERDNFVANGQYEESNIRETSALPGSAAAGPTSPARVPTVQVTTDTPARRTRAQQASRAISEDPDSPLSSPPTPHNSVFEKLNGKTSGRKAKIKQSPEKKSTAGYSGLSGVGGAGLVGSSPIGGDENEESSDNNDFCSACGGSGFLLCCDGCDRSFHFSCLDPPLSENASELNEPWYCFICVAKRPVTVDQGEKPARGLFAALQTNLRKRNPTNFSLPQEIRDYFEGVSADKDGHFIEAVQNRPTNRPGWDETPDYTKTKDAKGNFIFCFSCGKSSQGSGNARPIIQCDYCGCNWHLDCLDPPLANPPARGLDGKKVHDWMCPLHADQELRRLDTSLLYPRRRVHIRKPRNPRVVESSLRRGFVNNGIIEVINDDESSDDSDSEFYDEDTPEDGVVYRLPASGIKLDFIDKVKQSRAQDFMNSSRFSKRARPVAAANATTATPNQLQQANFAKRSFREKQTALNLAQFATSHLDLDIGGDQVQNLVGTLIAEAPAEVVSDMMAAEEAADALAKSSAIPPSPPSSEQTDHLSPAQRQQLVLLQELIRRRLESVKT